VIKNTKGSPISRSFVKAETIPPRCFFLTTGFALATELLFRSNPFPQFVATTASCLSPIRIKRHANVLAAPWQQSCPRETLVPPRCPCNTHRAVARAKRVQSLAGSPRQTTRYTTTQAVALALHSEPLARNQTPLLATLAPPNSIHAKQRFTSKARLSFKM
jgi:hypothetical protein